MCWFSGFQLRSWLSPSQEPMGVPVDQFSAPVPRRVSLDAIRRLQSWTSSCGGSSVGWNQDATVGPQTSWTTAMLTRVVAVWPALSVAVIV